MPDCAHLLSPRAPYCRSTLAAAFFSLPPFFSLLPVTYSRVIYPLYSSSAAAVARAAEARSSGNMRKEQQPGCVRASWGIR